MGNYFEFGTGRTLLGTFYRRDREWKAIPYYQVHRYINVERDLSQILSNAEEAIAYIKQMYEGTGRDSVSERVYLTAA